MQWLSLLILTIGCVIQKMDIPSMQNEIIYDETKGKIEVDHNNSSDTIGVESNIKDSDSTYFTIGTGLSLIFVQVRHTL